MNNSLRKVVLGLVFIAFGLCALCWYAVKGPLAVGIFVAIINFAVGGRIVYQEIEAKK